MITDILSFYRVIRGQGSRIHTLGLPILIVVSSLVYYFSFHLSFINYGDEGFLVNGALRVLEGQVPLSDFWSYPPGRYYVLAGLFLLLGVNLATERVMWIALMTLRNVLLYTVARRLLSPLVSLLLALSVMLVPGPWDRTLYSFLMFVHIFIVFKYIEEPGASRATLIGVAAGLMLYFRQDYTVFAILVNLVAVLGTQLLAAHFADLAGMVGIWRNRLLRSGNHIKLMMAAAVLSIVPLVLFYSLQGELAGTVRRSGLSVIGTAGRVFGEYSFPSLFELRMQVIHWPLELGQGFADVWFPYFMVSILIGSCYTAIVFIVRWLRGRTINTKQMGFLLVVLAWTGLTSYRVFGIPRFAPFLIASQSSLILAAFLLSVSFAWVKDLSFRKKGQHIAQSYTPRRFRRLASVFLLSVIGFSWYSFLYGGFHCPFCATIAVTEGELSPFRVARAQLMLPPNRSKKLQSIMEEIRGRTSENDTIFCYREPMFYFLSERRNATQLDNVVPLVAVDQEAAILVEAFQKNPPKLQVIRVSDGWLAELISQYPCAVQDALFGDYQVVATIQGRLFLQLSQGANAWEVVQEEFAKRGYELTRASDCQPDSRACIDTRCEYSWRNGHTWKMMNADTKRGFCTTGWQVSL
jgi:hypothetical protein